jgi:glycosidase
MIKQSKINLYMKKIANLTLILLLFMATAPIQAQTQVKKVIFQAFWWDYKNTNFPYGWANYLAELAPRLKSLGFNAVWIPPSYKNQAPNWVGYGPMDHYDLGDKYQKGVPITVQTNMGTKDELLRMIAVMHANGIEVIQDIVLNHVDGAGTSTAGTGGVDPNALSVQSNSGYKNFRYVSYATPIIDESQDDYWTRSGRWAKNYRNFHPNDNNNCTTGDICSAYFGPDIDYTATSFGQSANIPTTGTPAGYPSVRSYFNPPQTNKYMYDGAMNWLTWFKKQTGVDGLRWDAVKHFDIAVQRDGTRATKYSVAAANGGYAMTNIGEWIGSNTDLNTYVTNMAQASLGFGYEEHTGTFDFNLRGYGSGGSLYEMVTSNFSGTYNLANLPGLQQTKRYTDYATPSARVHRTIPFVNSHDTYRPILNPTTGNFSQALGISTGWDESQELGGNGKHIDPREPRMAAAYAVVMAMDGNPIVFFEDLFNVGTTGKRFTHQPTNTTDLPTWNDLENLIKCHQKLQFKEGSYKVRSAETAAFFPAGSTDNDHLVFERAAKAIIGVNDQYNADKDIWIDSDFPAGTILMDYSGANGTNTVTVQNDKRVYIKTKAVGHTVPNAFGHGYSVWAPVPSNVPFATVTAMLAYLDYTPTLTPNTQQEWEMADDLGDSHCQSLGQGGRTPDNSPNDRIVGKIFVNGGTSVSYTLSLGTVGNALSLDFYDLNGNLIHSNTGNTATVTGTFSNPATRWMTVKVRNTAATYLGQTCRVNVVYTAPSVITASTSPQATTVSIWNSNGGSNVWTDCRNWEEGKIPTCTGTVIVPHPVKFNPQIAPCFTGTIVNNTGSVLPLSIRDFKAQVKGDIIALSWLTADEKGLKGFELQRSVNGTEFKTIHAENARGNGLYTHNDADIAKGQIYYYRLKMVDTDGSYQYSTIQSARISAKNSVRIYPNPTDKNFYLQIQTDNNGETDAEVRLINLEGQTLMTQRMPLTNGENTLPFSIEHLPAGMYFLLVQLKTEHIQLKINKA